MMDVQIKSYQLVLLPPRRQLVTCTARTSSVWLGKDPLYVLHDVNNIAANHAAPLTDVTKSALAWLQVLTSTDGRDDKHSLRLEYLLPSSPLSITSLRR